MRRLRLAVLALAMAATIGVPDPAGATPEPQSNTLKEKPAMTWPTDELGKIIEADDLKVARSERTA